MNYTHLFIAVGLILSGSVASARLHEIRKSAKQESALNVVDNSKDFNQAVRKNKYVIAAFVNGDCGACKAIKHQLEEIASSFSKTVYFVEVSTKKCEQLCKEYKVIATPTFVFFKDGKHINAKVTKTEHGETETKEMSTVVGYHSPSMFIQDFSKIIHETFDISSAQ